MTDPATLTHSCAGRGACTLTRRAFAVGGSAALAGLLVACAGEPAGDPPASAADDGPLARVPLDDVPIGGGSILPAVPLVVTRPTETEARAFSGVCSHQGCSVVEVDDRGIICPCHTSIFDITDGAVLAGPAPAPLPALVATIEGDEIVVTLPTTEHR